MKLKESHQALIYLIPAFAVMMFICIYPLIYAIWISLHKWNYLTVYIPPKFAGAANFVEMFGDPFFVNTLMITFLFTGAAVCVELLIGIGIAVLLFRDLRGKRVIRAIVLVPMMVTPVIVGLTYKYILHPHFGVANYFLALIGIRGVEWYSAPGTSLATMVMIDIWQWTPLVVLIILAALSSLPVEPFEAAIIDGATRLQTFMYITLPMLKGAITMVSLIRMIDAMREFDKIYVLTRGGPGNTTDVLSIFGFREAFYYGYVGYAAAISLVLFIVTLVICMILIRVAHFK